MLRIEKTEDGHCTVLSLDGELSYDTAEILSRKVAELNLPLGQHVVLDLGGLDFLDSSGAACLMRLRKAVETESDVVLASVPSGIHTSLMRLGLINHYRVFSNTADAVLKLR